MKNVEVFFFFLSSLLVYKYYTITYSITLTYTSFVTILPGQLLAIRFFFTTLLICNSIPYNIKVDLETKLLTRIDGRKRKLLTRKKEKTTSTETTCVHNFDKLT